MLCVCSAVSDSEAPLTVACQAPLSTGLFRQEYWSGLPFPPPGGPPNPGIEPASPASPELPAVLYQWAIAEDKGLVAVAIVAMNWLTQAFISHCNTSRVPFQSCRGWALKPAHCPKTPPHLSFEKAGSQGQPTNEAQMPASWCRSYRRPSYSWKQLSFPFASSLGIPA